jgi:hypothetical protein
MVIKASCSRCLGIWALFKSRCCAHHNLPVYGIASRGKSLPRHDIDATWAKRQSACREKFTELCVQRKIRSRAQEGELSVWMGNLTPIVLYLLQEHAASLQLVNWEKGRERGEKGREEGEGKRGEKRREMAVAAPGIQRQVLLPHQVTPAPSAPPIHGSYCASMASTYLCLRPLLHQPLVSNLHPPINAVRLSPTVLLISPDLPGPNVGGTVSPERLQRSP